MLKITPAYNRNSITKIACNDVWLGSLDLFFKELQSNKINTNLYFVLLIEQAGTVSIDGIYYHLEKSDLVILTPFNIRFVDIPPNETRGHVVGFSESFYTVTHDHRNFLFETLAILNTPVYARRNVNKTDLTFVNHLFKQIHETYQEINVHHQQINCRILRALISVLMFYVRKRDYNQPSIVPNNANTKQLVVQFVKLLNEHFKEQSTIKFYTDQLATTETILKKYCKIILGITPKEVMQQKVIAEAKRLLINEDISAQEIAYELGYSDPTNFNKFFLKRAGMTPRQFRLQQRSKV